MLSYRPPPSHPSSACGDQPALICGEHVAALQLPQLAAIAHNGGESFKHAHHTQTLGVTVYKLPSTSPANASWSFERKLAAWREVMERHGLV